MQQNQKEKSNPDISKIRKLGHFSYQFLEEKRLKTVSQNIIAIIYDQAYKDFIWIDIKFRNSTRWHYGYSLLC